MNSAQESVRYFQGMDIYLLDQVMKNRFVTGSKVLDAGCGGGRNLTWFLHAGHEVHAVDNSAAAIEAMRQLAAGIRPSLSSENFRIETVEKMSFSDAEFDSVLSIAVLHFARDEDHFEAMLRGIWRVLRPGGLFFCRLASSIGIESTVRSLGNGQYLLPDGSTRFLVDQQSLLLRTEQLQARMLEPLKTVNVQGLRCMTTWVLQKASS